MQGYSKLYILPHSEDRSEEQVLAWAERSSREVLLRQGEHVPMLILHGDKGMAMVMIEGGLPETIEERERLCYRAAKQFPMNSRRNGVGTLLQVLFISEAWAITRTPETFVEGERPTLAADRKEVLIMAAYRLADDHQQVRQFEMLRTAGGVMHDLRRDHTADSETIIESPLLAAFVRGWREVGDGRR